MFRLNEIATRRDNGRAVRILDRRPVGVALFYKGEDVETGELAVYSEGQLRHATQPTRED